MEFSEFMETLFILMVTSHGDEHNCLILCFMAPLFNGKGDDTVCFYSFLSLPQYLINWTIDE